MLHIFTLNNSAFKIKLCLVYKWCDTWLFAVCRDLPGHRVVDGIRVVVVVIHRVVEVLVRFGPAIV